MPTAEHTVTIDAPIDQVFAYLADGTNNPHWRPGVQLIERTSPADGPSATYRQVLSGPAGRKIDGDYQITTYDHPHLLEFAVTAGPLRPTGRFELSQPDNARTTVRFSLSATPTGLMRMMGSMIGKQMRTEVAALDRLKTVLED
jgi:uncharacterized protein YndB with AHSA1/START domain